jgi:hypothetical protein
VRWTPPVQGTSTFQRLGDVINLKRLELQWFAVYGDNIGNIVRFAVIQTRGGFIPAALSDLFSFGATATEDVMSPWLPYILGKKIDVLYDSLFSLEFNASSAITVERCDIPIKVKSVEFVQGTSTGADGDIFFVMISDSAVIPHPSMNVVLRATYTNSSSN